MQAAALWQVAVGVLIIQSVAQTVSPIIGRLCYTICNRV